MHVVHMVEHQDCEIWTNLQIGRWSLEVSNLQRDTATTRADTQYTIQLKIPNRCINQMVLLVNVWYGVSFPNMCLRCLRLTSRPWNLTASLNLEIALMLRIVYFTVLYYTIRYIYYTILYYTMLCYTILYYTILYYNILDYTILYYTILYYTLHIVYTYFLYIFYSHGRAPRLRDLRRIRGGAGPPDR